MPGFVDDVARGLNDAGIDLAALGLAWARVAPTVAIVPAFGLRAIPSAARVTLGLVLAASVFPAVAPIAHAESHLPWVVLALIEIVRGLPIAIGAAAVLWAATMAGGVIDALRGANEAVSAPTVEAGSTRLGVLLSILASSIFLATGGPARVALSLASNTFVAHPIAAAARDVASSVTLAVSIGAPLLAASIAIEVAGALLARAASPAQLHTLLAPLRAIATLAIFALVFDRIAAVMAHAIAHAP